MIALRSERELERIRDACRIVGLAHRALREWVRPGISTSRLDRIAEELIRDQGALPAFKGYQGYPAATCISINEQVVHGIPGHRELRAGDLVSIDIGVRLKGYYGDQAISYAIGEVTPDVRKLITVTRESLFRGIEGAQEGRRLEDVCGSIQQWVESHGFSVVRQFVGHGIGRRLHEDPAVPNYVPLEKNPRLRQGIVIAIEPMVNLGRPEVILADDGWTASARDGLPSAHFEHVVAVTDDEPALLTMTEEEIFEGVYAR